MNKDKRRPSAYDENPKPFDSGQKLSEDELRQLFKIREKHLNARNLLAYIIICGYIVALGFVIVPFGLGYGSLDNGTLSPVLTELHATLGSIAVLVVAFFFPQRAKDE